MSNIKINDVFQRVQYAATNGQTQFTVPFPFFSNAYVTVWQDGILLSQGASAGQYLISGAGSPSGGLVTLITPALLDSIITIEGIMPIDRTSIYSATISNLTGSDLNGDFNREVVMMKQIQTTQALLQVQYAPWALVSQDPAVTTDRYLPLLFPNQAWVMNAAGTEIISFTLPSTGGVAPALGTYLVQTANDDLPDAQVMGELLSGIVVNTIGTGVQLTRSMAGTANQLGITNPTGIGGNPTYYIVDNPIIPGTAGVGIPQGTTAQRVTPVTGIGLRYNTDLGFVEYWNGSAWAQLARGTAFPSLPSGFMSVTTATGDINSRVLVPTANQIDITNVDGSGNPAFSLSSMLNLPGTFNIQSSNAISAIINDSSMNTASSSNISTSAAIKAYVDSLVTGLNIQGSCVCASTTALTVLYVNGVLGVGATLTNAGAQAAIQLDGVSPTVGQRVLIKNQAASLQNGIYTVTTVGTGITNWVLTRATDYDQASEIQPGDLVVLTGGTTQTNSSWLQTATVTTVGTDAITFVQFTASLPMNVASGGTGVTSFTAYAPIVGGTTTTGSLQSITLGAAGTLFQSAGVGALPGFTTTTYPTTNAINTIMFASSANVLGVITPVNNAVLISSAGGIPSMSTTLPSGISATSMVLTTPVIDIVRSAAGTNIVSYSSVASAVNYIGFTNSATGSPLIINAFGTDSNIDIEFVSKGTGLVRLISDNLTTPVQIESGTSHQHKTIFAMSNTNATRTVTFKDADGTLAFTSDIPTFGTGVVTALGINVGSAGAFVTFNGALGTPSSGTLTNATGLPISGITGLGTGVGTALAVTANATTGFAVITTGTFTPVLTFGAGGVTGITYSTQSGLYQRVGLTISFSVSITLTSKGSSTGTATITGLPVASRTSAISFFELSQAGITYTGVFRASLNGAATTLNLVALVSSTGDTALDNTAFTNTSVLRISGTYQTD